MPQIPLPQISLGKRKDSSLMSHISTTDGRCLPEEIPIIQNCAVSEKHTCLFMTESTEMYQGKDGNYYQLFSDKSMIPLMPKSESAKKAELEKHITGLSDQIFDLTEDIKVYEQFQNMKKNDKGDLIKWCVSVFGAVFVIIAAINYFKG